MAHSVTRFNLVGSVLTGACVALVGAMVPPAAVAQTTDPGSQPVVDPNAGFTSPDGGGAALNDTSSVMDLIHRAVLMDNMSLGEFNSQIQNQVTEEAGSFQQRQQEAIRQQQAEAAAAEAAAE